MHAQHQPDTGRQQMGDERSTTVCPVTKDDIGLGESLH